MHPRLWLVAGLSLCHLVSSAPAAILVGGGPSFTYSYAPRAALGLDPNALYDAVRYNREPPSFKNCSFIIPLGTTNLSQGTVDYEFRPDDGSRLEHVTIFQRATLFTSGSIRGEHGTAVDGGFSTFFLTPPYLGTAFAHERWVALRYLECSNLHLRYTLTLTNGFNFSVQFLRDCDDNPTTWLVQGSIVSAETAARTRLLVPAGALWRYLDDGSVPPVGWSGLGFEDGPWPAGRAELGYGDGDEATTTRFGPDPNNKFITTYYRHSFVVTNAHFIEQLRLGVVRDDGVVVYLNGQEVFRDNLPAGVITPAVRAGTALGGTDEATFIETDLAAAWIREGTNVVAAEVHQASPTSSDLSFNLDLAARWVRPRLNVQRVGACVALDWEVAGAILESADTPTGPWDAVPNQPRSPYTICGAVYPAFYRLRLPGL